MLDLKTLDEETLFRIQESCALGKWPEQIGEKPSDFDSLPAYKRKWQFWIKITKLDYLYPIYVAAKSLISDAFWELKMRQSEQNASTSVYLKSDSAEKIFLICEEDGVKIPYSKRQALIGYFSDNSEPNEIHP